MSLTKDIERPLGQSLPPAGTPRGKPTAGRGRIVAGVTVLGVFGLSALIALSEKPFRTPPAAVEQTPVAVAIAPAAAEAPQQQAAAKKTGPSIIHVSPPDETTGGIVVVGDPSAVAQNPRTAHLPDRALLEDSPDGPLPVRAADGRRPFDVYARPWSQARGARVAIVIGGLGVSQTGTQSSIAKLPPEVTLAFATQGNSLGRWM
ncbi:MAG: divergent polysaccharide deacetylase family protein, partial [Rhizobiaceae bacterium]|nr:divergent polysaccharide deacetylase family protein [Rhizobiaceae bacterium]